MSKPWPANPFYCGDRVYELEVIAFEQTEGTTGANAIDSSGYNIDFKSKSITPAPNNHFTLKVCDGSLV